MRIMYHRGAVCPELSRYDTIVSAASHFETSCVSLFYFPTMQTFETVKIDHSNWYQYYELFEIVEYRKNSVFKTKSIGYVKKGYVTPVHHSLAPLSTKLLGKTIQVIVCKP